MLENFDLWPVPRLDHPPDDYFLRPCVLKGRKKRVEEY